MSSNYLVDIKQIAQTYFDELNVADFSHDFTHVERVTRLALHIGKIEKADLIVLKAASLLHDIARGAEDRGEITDHAAESAKLANEILVRVKFPKDKIENVIHSINVHRSRPDKLPKTLEAKILQDADRLDALGAVDITRVVGSSLQSKQYRMPVYVDEPYRNKRDYNKSAIHYLIHKIVQPKRKPENFNTKTGQRMAKERFEFTKNYINRFIKEWRGEI